MLRKNIEEVIKVKEKTKKALIITALSLVLVGLVLYIAAELGAFKKGDKLQGIRKELTAVELTRLMGNGINLGNTMEAYGHASLGTNAAVSSYETLWGQPVTTQEMITAMKNSGFDTIRIPVAWTNTMNFESGDYTIREDWFARIEEIVGYAMNENMYVIVNDHWDGSWWGMFGSATAKTRQKAMDMYISLWTQIAERFKNYSDYLIFESANEELGDRLNDQDIAKDSGTLSTNECYEVTNKINQTFVDTVRATGGNNSQRFLLIAGYGTDIKNTCDDRYVMPSDSAQNKLLVSVHYYEPFSYCGSASLSSWGTIKHYEKQNELLKMMTKFTDAGYGVIFGEYAVALNGDGSVKDNTCDFINNFLDNCDLYNYCPVLWDCSSLFKRSTLSWLDTDVEALYKARSYETQSSLDDGTIKENAKAEMAAALAAAPESLDNTTPAGAASDETIAWLMFNSNDWNVTYSVGDEYNPSEKTEGIVAEDVKITGEGTYTVSLDFSKTGAGYANSTVFCALGISNGELLYPGYIINVVDLQINGKSYPLVAEPYTTTDDKKCTRMNIYNAWVKAVPVEARTEDGDLSAVAPCIVDNEELGNITSISLTFEYKPGK